MVARPLVAAVPRLIEALVGAGPRESLGRFNQSGFHWIVFDVSHNPLELLSVADPPIVTLRLPKWLSAAPQQFVRFAGRSAFH
jgi:hypothetical protein